MVKAIASDAVRGVQRLYRENPLAQRFFDSLAQRSRDATATTIDNMMRSFGVARGDAVALARSVSDTGCAELWLGRRGAKTRLVWSYSCVSIGQAAAGETEKLEVIEDPEPEPIENEYAGTEEALEDYDGTKVSMITITDAKRLLAKALGVEQSSIEITIRA